MHNQLNLRRSSFSRILSFVLLSGSLCLLFDHNLIYAEETQLNDVNKEGLSWGRKYFFDAPRFKDDNIQELLDAAIEDKLNSYGIEITEGNSSKYVLAYTIVLEESATELEIKDLYEHEPELKDSSNGDINFEHGKFIISIRDRETFDAIWRNNLERIAGLDISDKVRQKRVKTFVDQVFMTFPDELKNSQ